MPTVIAHHTRDTTEDVEDTWLPVLAALQRHLTKAD